MRKADGSSGLADITASQIARQIESGQYQPGQQLPPERDLAEQLGVSRTAVREAFRALQALGLVEAHVGRGRFVTDHAQDKRSHFLAGQLFDLHANDLTDLSDVRQLLESTAVMRIPQSDCPAVASVLSAITDQATDALERGDLQTFAVLDSEFHAAPLAFCPNRALRALANGVMVAMGRNVREVLSDRSRVEASLAEHRRIISAFEAGDIELAALLTGHHQTSSHQRRIEARIAAQS